MALTEVVDRYHKDGGFTIMMGVAGIPIAKAEFPAHFYAQLYSPAPYIIGFGVKVMTMAPIYMLPCSKTKSALARLT